LRQPSSKPHNLSAAPRFTPRQIDAFLAVAELQSFRLAAIRINLTPSAVSNLIGELEASLGFAVFARSTRKVSLTQEGRRFLPAASAVQRQIEQAAAAAADIRESRQEIVRIAAPLVVASILLPNIIAALDPALELTVNVIDTPVVWLADRIAMGEADLAVGPDRETPAHIQSMPLMDTPWVLWCQPDHPLAAQAQVEWAALADIPIIAAGRDHEQRVWPQLAARDSVPRRIKVVEHITTSLGLAASGLGVTFSPDYVAPLAEALGLVPRPLVVPVVNRHLCLYARADEQAGPVRQVIDHILNGPLAPTARAPTIRA
jgi:DNA-binding transcriptional LysR family regulator